MSSSDLVCDLFCALVDLSNSEREAYLARGRYDASVVEAVVELLQHEERATEILPALSEPAHYLSVGDVLGDFKILRELGRGGMGVVFLAEERPLNRLVALKFLLFPNAILPEDIERLRREARVVAKLGHPSVVKVLRFGETDHRLFIAYEFVEGSDLAQLISNRTGPAANIRRAARFLADIADALHHAHKNEIVHRDVKPSNILVDTKGRGYLTDFGLAVAGFESDLTRTGTFAGTCKYMSPEQALPATQTVDYRTDIYSLGVVLYELACHRTPFEGDSGLEILKAIVDETPRSLREIDPSIPRDLELICATAMQKRPEARFQTAADFAADLRRFAEGDAILTRPDSMWTKLTGILRRQKRRLLALSGVAFAVLMGLVVGFNIDRGEYGLVQISAPNNSETHAFSLNAKTGEYGYSDFIGSGATASRLAPGFYRFVVIDEEGRFAELSRLVRSKETLKIDALALTHPDDHPDMIAIAGGKFVAGLGGPFAEQWPREEYNGESFLIGRLEVTNAEFRQFLAATDNTGPDYLGESYDNAWDELPVVNVTWFQARAYAEWAGARLPTRLEWDRAARGREGFLYPWGDESKPSSDVCVGRLSEKPEIDQWFDAYIQHACRVGTSSDDVSHDALSDVMGGATEWTDTPDTQLVDGQITILPGNRLAKGTAWWHSASTAEIESIVQAPASAPVQRYYFGLRLAKSRTPSIKKSKETNSGQ